MSREFQLGWWKMKHLVVKHILCNNDSLPNCGVLTENQIKVKNKRKVCEIILTPKNLLCLLPTIYSRVVKKTKQN